MNAHRLKKFAVPLFLFLFSLLLRLSLISLGPFHGDCLNLALQAEETLATLRIHPLPGFGYPLTVLLGAGFIGVTRFLGNDNPVFAVNLMSVVFGALGIPLLYLLAKKLFNGTTALFSAVLFSLHPFFLGVSLFGMSHTPSIFFLLAGLLLLSYYKKNARRLYLLLSGGALGLAGAARLQDLILMLVPVAFFFFFVNGTSSPKRQEASLASSKTKEFLLLGAVILLTALPLHLPLFVNENYRRAAAFSWFWEKQLVTNFLGLFSFPLKVSFGMILDSLSWGGILGVLVGLGLLASQDIKKFIFLLLWFCVPFFFYGNVYTATSRFFIPAVIPLLIVEGYLLARLYSCRFRALRIFALLVFFFILAWTGKNVFPVFMFRHRNAPLVEFSRWVNTMTEPNAVLIVSDERKFIEYYGGRKAVHNPCGIYFVNKQALGEFKQWLDGQLQNHIPVYITGSGLVSGDISHEFRDLIQDHYSLKFIGRQLAEDWHRGETKLCIGQESLYKLAPQPEQ